jgi:phosphoglycolate phosphatase
VLVLLDLDGTLTDPHEGVTRSVAYAWERMGLPPLGARELRSFIGPPLQDQLASHGLDAIDVERAVALYRERFSDCGLYENRLYDGVVDVLDGLLEAGLRLAVATSKPTPFAERIVDHFELTKRLELVAGATLDGARRAKADVIGYALAALDVPARDAVMVGDRAQDIEGARVHRMRSIGVRWGYAEPGELEAAGADVIVDDPAALLAVLVP